MKTPAHRLQREIVLKCVPAKKEKYGQVVGKHHLVHSRDPQVTCHHGNHTDSLGNIYPPNSSFFVHMHSLCQKTVLP